jgi:hypothetical protein
MAGAGDSGKFLNIDISQREAPQTSSTNVSETQDYLMPCCAKMALMCVVRTVMCTGTESSQVQYDQKVEEACSGAVP